MKNTHESFSEVFQDPADDCELPEPVRTEDFQTATCKHGTLFLLVTLHSGVHVWKDARKYWDRAREDKYSQQIPLVTQFYDDIEAEQEIFIDCDWDN